MEMPKPTEDDKKNFRALVPDDPRVEVKPMFGNLAAFINGNMFMGLFGSAVGVKLNKGDRELLLTEDGAGPFGPAERPMGGYISLPEPMVADAYKAELWVAKSFDYVASLPAKVKKPKK